MLNALFLLSLLDLAFPVYTRDTFCSEKSAAFQILWPDVNAEQLFDERRIRNLPFCNFSNT